MADDLTPEFELPSVEDKRKAAGSNADMIAHFKFTMAKQEEKLRESKNVGRGVYSDARKKHYPDWNKR